MFMKQSTLLLVLILLMLTASSGFGQIRYSDYSNSPLTVREVAFVGKLLPIVAEYNERIRLYKLEIERWETRVSTKDIVIDMLESNVKSWELFAEEIQAKWWQSPVAIVVYMITSFVIGIMIAL